MRLARHEGERIDRERPVVFRFGEKRIEGYAGDTFGSALYAAGLRTFSRSFKYHRTRGLLCCTGHCPNCMMTVDGVPNVRVCVEPLREGAHVTAQNVWGNLDLDVLSAHRQSGRAVHARRLLLPDDDPAAPCVAAVREGSAKPRRARPRRRAGRTLAPLRRGAPARARSRRRRVGCRSGSCTRGGRRGTRSGPGRRRAATTRRPGRGRGAHAGPRARDLGGRPRPRGLRNRALPLPGGAHHRRDRRARAADRVPGQRSGRRDAAERGSAADPGLLGQAGGPSGCPGRRRARTRGRGRAAGGGSRAAAGRRPARDAGTRARGPASARPRASAAGRWRGDRVRSRRRLGRAPARVLPARPGGRPRRVRLLPRSIRPHVASARRRSGRNGHRRRSPADRRPRRSTRDGENASCASART